MVTSDEISKAELRGGGLSLHWPKNRIDCAFGSVANGVDGLAGL